MKPSEQRAWRELERALAQARKDMDPRRRRLVVFRLTADQLDGLNRLEAKYPGMYKAVLTRWLLAAGIEPALPMLTPPVDAGLVLAQPQDWAPYAAPKHRWRYYPVAHNMRKGRESKGAWRELPPQKGGGSRGL